MKFRYVGPSLFDEDGIEQPVNAYGGAKLKNGDEIELEGHLAKKALNNENYKEVKPRVRSKKSEAVEAAEIKE